MPYQSPQVFSPSEATYALYLDIVLVNVTARHKLHHASVAIPQQSLTVLTLAVLTLVMAHQFANGRRK